MAATAARAAALDMLRAVRGGALADVALDAAAAGLDSRDRAWTQELVYGTLRLRARLDHSLAGMSRRPLDRLDPDILDILRLGAYQLLEMGGVPAYAAVSESVELAKRAAGRGAGGFVNGVLQSLRRQGGHSTFPSLEADALGHLTTWGSHPEWLVRRWLDRFGPAGTLALVEANNSRPELYARALGGAAGAVVPRALAQLGAAGITAEPVAFAPRALHVTQGSAADAVAAAPVIVQDPAAGLVATYAAVPSGVRVLDLAAAPGGKALALAADRGADGPAWVGASDLSPRRLQRMRQNIARLTEHGVAPPVGLVVADARQPPFRPAEVVLLDAPCTGTGTFRRHPDGRWRVRPADLASLMVLQRDLLDAAASCVMPGGLLVYSTCSLEPEENDVQVRSFLERHPAFALEAAPGFDAALLDDAGMLSVLPQSHGVDGAFAARLRRLG